MDWLREEPKGAPAAAPDKLFEGERLDYFVNELKKCQQANGNGVRSVHPSIVATGDAATRVYVAPGSHDEYYSFMSGGFSGQITVYGLPSGRLLKTVPVFSQNPENGYGYNEETKPMLQTSHGFVPWDDTHHLSLSQTDGVPDGRWVFINGNNTPRVARIDLTTFETTEILEIPNAAGGHASPFTTPDTKYIVSATRFSVPVPGSSSGSGHVRLSASPRTCLCSRLVPVILPTLLLWQIDLIHFMRRKTSN